MLGCYYIHQAALGPSLDFGKSFGSFLENSTTGGALDSPSLKFCYKTEEIIQIKSRQERIMMIFKTNVLLKTIQSLSKNERKF